MASYTGPQIPGENMEKLKGLIEMRTRRISDEMTRKAQQQLEREAAKPDSPEAPRAPVPPRP